MLCRVVLAGCAIWAMALCPLHAAEAPQVDFTRDIRPLLAKRCYSCHGAEQAEASLRLDRKTDALRGGNSGPAFVPGHSDQSRLVSYVAGTSDDDMVMPPEGERLSTTEVAMIRSWIDQGAAWPEEKSEGRKSNHWSFQPIKPTAPPKVAHSKQVRNAIDRFVLAKLEAAGLEPSPEADRTTLLRRVTLDLTGLPPTPQEVDDFIADRSPKAYERVVDRLLASPHYGERWARHWLDLARYADSDGYEKDTGRPNAWRYRQWVIESLNRDLPFDEFTIEQLAGDLLPNATTEQLVATGFHRNTLTNKEGGVDQEQFRVAATIDRVNTTGTVWLGLTVGCAQCHTHKYDPILQREYYGLFAFYNSLDETQTPAPLADQVADYKAAKAKFDAEHARLVAKVKEYESKSLPKQLAAWEKQLGTIERTVWTTLEPSALKFSPGPNVTLKHVGSGVIEVGNDNPETGTYIVTAPTRRKRITALRLEVLADPSLPGHGPGRAPNGNFVLSELRLQATPLERGKSQIAAGAKPKAVTIRSATSDVAQTGFPLAHAFDGDAKTGWAIAPATGRDHVAVFELAKPIETADGVELSITFEQQYRGQTTLGRFRLSIADGDTPIWAQGIGPNVVDALATPAAARTSADRKLIVDYFRKLDPELTKRDAAVVAHAKQAPIDPATTVLAQTLRERSPGRETHILVRGDFLRPGARVEPHTLEALNPLKPADPSKPTRLDLARWLVDPKNPLTARVTINRIWSHYFGRGIVATVDDFGTQGEKPSHPELLDWLAHEFQRQGWSLKALHRLIVTSATYRQSSKYRHDLAEHDPLNTLLARQRRLRVEAEVVRDVSLAASGLLDPRVGGPSVRPRQPADIAALTYASGSKWVDSSGADLYRRGLYTWFQRTSPYPMLMTFDAPDSNVTCARRERSNTPLQALTLLNDPAFFECAQSMARRVLREAPSAHDARLRYALKLCVGRNPNEEELATLGALFDEQRTMLASNAEATKDLLGNQPTLDGTTTEELAAWTMVARTLLNLDEFIVRE
ncbi:MAG TPA: PSD1 and planctomycete cytochrome C domain-containing protein [Pirellulales bacterium]|nr:PSD1 and planctomycete cytochrome C domain-containing protein [Pirellulales bacterium]